MTAALAREAAHDRRREPQPPLAVLFWPPRPWWLIDMAEWPGWSREQIAAGLTVPAVEREPGR